MAAEATGAEGFGEAAGGDSTALEWASPGVSLRKRILTGVGVALVAALFLFIAWYENASMLISTLIGLVFIGCFIWYLRIVAPTPYTIRLDDAGITRTERNGEAADHRLDRHSAHQRRSLQERNLRQLRAL